MSCYGTPFFFILLTIYQLGLTLYNLGEAKKIKVTVLLLLMCSLTVFAEKKISITDDFECAYLGTYSYLFEDTSHQITINDLLPKPLNEWEVSTLEKPRKGVSSSIFWSQTTIENKTNQSQSMTIVLEYPMVDWVQFFMVDGKKEVMDQSKAMGDIQPFDNRTIQHHYFVYNFTFPPNSRYDFYCKTGQLGGKFYLPLQLYKQNSWISQNSKTLLRHGLLLGFVSILCLISLISFIRTRKIFLLFFTLQNLSFALFYLAFNGMGFQYIWPNSIPYQQIGTVQTMNALTIFKVLFLITFFNFKQVRPVYRAFLFILGIQIICFILPILIAYIPVFNSPFLAKLSRLLNFSITALLLFMILALCLVYYRKTKDHKMRWYLYFLSFQIIIGLISFIPYFTKIDMGNFTTANVNMFSSMIEGLVLTIIIINYFKDTFFEKEQLALMVAQKQTEAYQNLFVGQEKERKRLSQELHDGLSIQLNLLKQKLTNSTTGDGINLSADFSEILTDVDNIQQDLRNFSHALNPTILKQLGLKKAVHDLIYRIEMSDLDLDIQFDALTDLSNLSKDHTKHLYHILQELLNNTLKYAEASEINIELNENDNQKLILSYSDNGIGYDEGKATTKGIGLKNIQARVAILKGDLIIKPINPSGMLHQIIMSN